MKKITLLLFAVFALCSTWQTHAQHETLATASRSGVFSNPTMGQSRALDATIYDTTHASNQGVEITTATGGVNHSMGDAIVLASTERQLTSITLDLFNLASAANYNLTVRIYTACPSNGLAGSACGTGPGVLVPGSTQTVNITPGTLGFLYTRTINFPTPVNLTSEVDNTITVMLTASRTDVFWVLGETPVVGAMPAGEVGNGFVTRCGSATNNNGCSRNFGIANNFAMTLVASGPPPNDLCANAISITSGVYPGYTSFGTIDGPAVTCGTSSGTSPDVWYTFTDISGTGMNVGLTTCSPNTNYDTKISVFTGTCGALVCVDGNDDDPGCATGGGLQSTVNFVSDGSSTYYVLVHGFGGQTGLFDLTATGIIIGAPPMIVCPADISTDTDPGVCNAVVNFTNAIAIDPEDGPIPTTQTGGLPSGSMFPTGVSIVEFSATDSDGNTSTCSFTITVIDMEAPVAACQDITVELDPVTGSVTITPADIDNGSTDNCGIVTYSLDIDTFTCGNEGPNTVNLTVTDAEGNSSSCSATVTVEDNTAPVVVCIGEPATIVGTASANPALAIPDNDPAGISTTLNVTDDFTISDLNVDLNISHTWVGDVIVTIQSPGGTSVTILDQPGVPASTFGCSGDNIVASLDDEAGSPVEDECGAGVPTISGSFTPNNPLSAFDGESTLGVWTLTVSDNAGGDTGTINSWGITYEYQAASSAYEAVLDANGTVTFPASNLLMSVDEVCGYVVTVGGPATTVPVTECGNAPESIPAGAPGTTSGPMNPSIATVSEAGIVGTDYTLDRIEVNLIHTWASDIQMTLEAPSGATINVMTGRGGSSGLDVAATLVFTDASSNDVTLWTSNANGPLADYQAEGGLFNTVFAGESVAGDWTLLINDNAGGDTGTMNSYCITFSPIIDTNVTFDCSQLGENQVEVFVTDNSGNSTSCIATVNVTDVTSPILVCWDVTIELGPDGTAEVDPADLLAVTEGVYDIMVIGSDNSSGTEGFTDFTVPVTEAANITFDWDYTLNDAPGFDSFGYLLNGVYTMLTDPGLGNQSGSAAVAVAPGDVFGFRSQTDDNIFGNNETVISNFVPGFTGQFDPANWTLTLTNSDGDAFFVEVIPPGPLSYDACGITVLAVDVTEVTCADIGTPVTATVFASDASGNIASCQSIITVVDLLAPELVCPADQTVDPGAGNLFYEVPDYFGTGEASATDNCTDPVVILSQSPPAGTLLPDGVYPVTITAEDEYGNESTCVFTLTVETILGVDDNNLDVAIVMYPNPAQSQVTIANNSTIALDKAAIYDINGKLVMTIDLQTMQGEKVIDISRLASGVYMVQISSDQASVVKRLIKE
ncbi:putative secreted protein (Por secretion system target) [Ulvibacter sp. MAR_2010_11]|uniref:proprotein convertase P-domain-containing protein n=1 Tax=Ulvibacter sp. MAR_2010_11 TaxID=1250229 RepID=UPI000C2C4C48|nr:proprotein convertase P-domain-containing protein [Ulvibacter sp. MAR_2010_11]PKA83687.1 putative secreted protein (Por secretion system target) [Ulvibacter sp. MAR_2010_11]